MKKNKTILNYILKYKISVFLYIITILTEQLSIAFFTIFAAKSIEFVTLNQYKNAINHFIICAIFIFTKLTSRYITNHLYYKTGGKIIRDLNCDLSFRSFELSSKTYSDNSSGLFVERIVNMPQQLIHSFAEMLFIVTELLSSFIILIYVATLNFVIFIILGVIVGICILIEKKRQKNYEKNTENLNDVEEEITSLASEIIKSEKDIKALGLESSLSILTKEKYDKKRCCSYKCEMDSAKLWSANRYIIELGYIMMLIVSIIMMEKSIITIVSFMIIYSYMYNIYDIVSDISGLSTVYTTIKAKCKRIFSIFDEDLFESEKFGDVNVEHIVGNIEFKNISFSYKDYRIEKDKETKKEIKVLETETPVFENLSFQIPHNKTVAFVGKSGSGKSTILGLLSKIYNADNGKILIDGHDIQSLDKETLRNTFSLVNQFPYIFDMTIKENLLMANKEASDEELNEVIKQAYLEEFLHSLKEGINTKVGENGIKLSGGQKQRFAIARALLRKSPIILFDESTSSLDNIAQKEVKNSIDALKGKSTIVIVAHRLSTIKDVDIIFFLDEGEIIAQGTFYELYNNNEKFRNMFLAENI